ncbi:MAG: bifunctional phosphopantothenoylcysteine decarboxylase/phosphopantothenate--cysteine ligase CoaBC [Anaerolineae bacterium]|jgi:phosphopantothenoylcysteine decarboxylase/phosphopantothenate--cysteine ligase
MDDPLSARRIVLGVSGSIAAYKAVDLASKLAQAGASVETVLTAAALQFVTPLSFQSVTGLAAYTDAELWGAQAHVLHIGLGQHADLLVIAPATAQTMAKLANGLADNLLSLTALAARCPIVIAPAMDAGMFAHPATQNNLRILEERGVVTLGPEEGHLASGLVAKGRMSEPWDILEHVRYLLSRGGPLHGRKIVVTAGGTQERLDPVRFLTNRSTGKQGKALARAALEAGAEVVLIATPIVDRAPAGVALVRVRTAAQMADAVLEAADEADALIMAAAVADFRPVLEADHKIKKASGLSELPLERTTDILSAIAELRKQSGFPRVVVGFAAETEDLLDNARNKLRDKGLDFIAANDVSGVDTGFAADTNRVTLLDAAGGQESLPLLDKLQVAREIVDRLVGWLTGGEESGT